MPDRPIVQLRLRAPGMADGEISLADLELVAHETQQLVRRIGRQLVGRRGPGRADRAIQQATTLTLVGLHRGSTILDIAGVEPMIEGLLDLEAPLDLSDRAITLWADGLAAIAPNGGQPPDLPVGFDSHMVGYLDNWLRPLRRYHSVGLTSEAGTRLVQATVEPRAARKRLYEVSPQPSLPWVTGTDQALTGFLYQVNLSTGTFSIRDRTEHVTRLTVPPDLRSQAAQFIGTRVQAIGRPEIDDAGRLVGFHVSLLLPVGDNSVGEQPAMIERSDLVNAEGAVPFDRWGIPGLRDDEVSTFQTALRQVRETE